MASGTGLMGLPGNGRQIHMPPGSVSRRKVPLPSLCWQIWQCTGRRNNHPRVMWACVLPATRG